MKKIALTHIFLIVASLGFAQSFSWGIKGGLNYNSNGDYKNTVMNAVENPDQNVGFHLGLFAQVGQDLFVRPELMYTSTKSSYDSGDFNYKRIDAPVLVGLKIIGPLNIFAGPAFQYVLDTDFDFDSISVHKLENDFTVGLNIGIGIQFKRLGIDVRYERGFTENEAQFFNNNNVTFGTLDTRQEQLSFSLSYAL